MEKAFGLKLLVMTWKADQVRETFLEFFRERGHLVYPSSPLLPRGDPTLLFTNAGMNQFKIYFLAEAEPPSRRITTCQKCLRAGGKHNDLENVGYTRRHHTFFEMLGNFSFGDYFKKEAISWAWELLTEVFKLDRNKLYVSVFREDEESYLIWRDEIGIEPERIWKLGEEDNFWEMGDVGPCGPSTEIYYDLGEELGEERYLEIWNIVFMQFNRRADGMLEPLPKKNVDTGMGLERILSVLQGVDSNYHTDLFMPIIQEIERLTGVKYYGDARGVPHRVISDHVRALTFAIADEIYPSNYGRGYVLRRILRRAHRFAQKIGYDKPILYNLVDVVVEIMGKAYPEIVEKREIVKRIVRSEEERFISTIGRNLVYLHRELEASKDVLSGESVFKLYDTYGIPLDMIEEVAKERGLRIDWQTFYKLMDERRQASLKASKTKLLSIDDWDYVDDGYTSSKFVGYTTLEHRTRIAKYKITNKQDYIVLHETPFYPEGGGQIGDRGTIVGDGILFKVHDTKRIGPDIVHIGKFERKESIPQEVVAKVDGKHRASVQRAHTGTHLLHSALHRIVGEHARQQGSLVAPDRIRFDFSHSSPLSKDELRRIEELVNSKIREDLEVVWEYKRYTDAISEGAIAIFEEKYGDIVRVVSIGDFSKELCGGTHVSRTGEIGFFKIVKEESSASGIRRIEAYVGERALEYVHELEDTLEATAVSLKTDVSNLKSKSAKLVQELENLKKDYDKLLDRYVSLLSHTVECEGEDVKVCTAYLRDLGMDALRKLADVIQDRYDKVAILLVSRLDDRLIYHMRFKNLENIDARNVNMHVSRILGGKGGGKSGKFEGGGRNLDGVNEAIAKFREMMLETKTN